VLCSRQLIVVGVWRIWRKEGFILGGWRSLRFVRHHQDCLIKDDEAVGVSSLDDAVKNACSVSGAKSERRIPAGRPRQGLTGNTETIVMKQELRILE
jgi:hypothetical protein